MADIRVLVVDDSAVVRHIVAQVLETEQEITVVGTAANGRLALDKIDELLPDAITLDIEMPELDGLGTLKALRQKHPRIPVIMFSTLTERGASKTLEALSLGASDYVTKPSNTTALTDSVRSVREQLVPKLLGLCGRTPVDPGPRRRTAPAASAPVAGVVRPRTPLAGRTPLASQAAQQEPVVAPPGPAVPRSTARPEIVAIGSSTGGPEALAKVLTGLPANLRVPVVVVQHMPPIFTRLLAERLTRTSPLEVREAAEGDVLRPGLVLVAPGDFHMELKRAPAGTVVHLTSGPPENFCRPAVDVLFRSVAATYGGATLAVVLTGMGSDGRKGAQFLKAKGATVLAQDEATSVVWGMPGAVTHAGLADQVLPISAIAGAVTDAVGNVPHLTAMGVRP
ncbi:response regulator receiver-modulated CheB methylesterase [Motilibacter rhizosphaerae]|uniref:Protein-glutamate methylesterase/protein-glutamine glutaminase n=1 Tax=Motilibacter rhizosphaerae TaxID=598652 RepID=A0A4Q7NWU3_9ACTN|nr:chemotaxis response regulator protein-glutamate methylesterase [Motilibacter rhizosphaerae]RZS91388.1 response regulator receiver-modulated CheB methylesterase [Motilibacter rhizosphaerae]